MTAVMRSEKKLDRSILDRSVEKMWQVLPTIQPLADKYGFGEEWQAMIIAQDEEAARKVRYAVLAVTGTGETIGTITAAGETVRTVAAALAVCRVVDHLAAMRTAVYEGTMETAAWNALMDSTIAQDEVNAVLAWSC